MTYAAALKHANYESLSFLDVEMFSDALEGVYQRSALKYCGLLFEASGGQSKIPGTQRASDLDRNVERVCDDLIAKSKHPALALGRGRFTPFDFSRDVDALRADKDIAGFFDAINASDYCSAYYLPFRDVTGALYISGVVSRDRVMSAMELRLVYSYCLDALEKVQSAAPTNINVAVLTGRERECLVAAAKGLTEKQCAQKLSISPFTVRAHLESCKRKLGARNKLNAIIKGLNLGEILPADIEMA